MIVGWSLNQFCLAAMAYRAENHRTSRETHQKQGERIQRQSNEHNGKPVEPAIEVLESVKSSGPGKLLLVHCVAVEGEPMEGVGLFILGQKGRHFRVVANQPVSRHGDETCPEALLQIGSEVCVSFRQFFSCQFGLTRMKIHRHAVSQTTPFIFPIPCLRSQLAWQYDEIAIWPT